MDTRKLIAAQAISIEHHNRHILDKVSLHISEGDFITLIGPNGAGKSILLKTMLGLYTPDSGKVTRRANLRIGYVPEKIDIESSLPLSVLRFLQSGIKHTKATQSNMDEIIEETQIAPLLTHQLITLSSGEIQRVLLARALVLSPDLLILDEAAQNLDISSQLHFYELIEKIYQSRTIAILMVSHDLNFVMSSTRKVVCLYHHICCEGAPQTVAKDPEFINLFGKDMARMMSVYPHHHDHKH